VEAGLAVEVEAEFVVEFAVEGTAVEEGAKAVEEVV
jgi:hypothetical protein